MCLSYLPTTLGRQRTHWCSYKPKMAAVSVVKISGAIWAFNVRFYASYSPPADSASSPKSRGSPRDGAKLSQNDADDLDHDVENYFNVSRSWNFSWPYLVNIIIIWGYIAHTMCVCVCVLAIIRKQWHAPILLDGYWRPSVPTWRRHNLALYLLVISYQLRSTTSLALVRLRTCLDA